MDSIDRKFQDAVDFINNSESTHKPSQDEQLKFYALYKQATQGDVSGKKPGMLDLVGRAKYNAWSKLKGMPQEQAKKAYVEALAAQVK